MAGEFNHPVIKKIIIRSIWSPPGKLSECFPISETTTIDPLIAFAAAMARWALNNLKLGRELAFQMKFDGGIYNKAVERIREIRNEDGIRLHCLDLLTTDILRHAQKLISHYSPVD